jgi:hypothetical protein
MQWHHRHQLDLAGQRTRRIRQHAGEQRGEVACASVLEPRDRLGQRTAVDVGRAVLGICRRLWHGVEQRCAGAAEALTARRERRIAGGAGRWRQEVQQALEDVAQHSPARIGGAARRLRAASDQKRITPMMRM